MVYNNRELEIIRSNVFDAWLSDLTDREARAQIQKRIARMQLGNFGDAKKSQAKDIVRATQIVRAWDGR